ncbi:hypothetical protein Syun_012676 [Stephania yunnanensis]|uniref:C3H1-type domain-containing protein n=1 Tax=Stephania yunnanensis TaxID=152371 RepID=A0AAP0PJP5_9MAGN
MPLFRRLPHASAPWSSKRLCSVFVLALAPLLPSRPRTPLLPGSAALLSSSSRCSAPVVLFFSPRLCSSQVSHSALIQSPLRPLCSLIVLSFSPRLTVFHCDSSQTPPTVNELYLHLHTVNHDGMTFIDTRSERFYDRLQRRRLELTQATPDQSVDDEAVYLNVAGECPKGRAYGLGSLKRKKRRYADPGASTSQMPEMVPRAKFDIVAEQLRKVMEFMHQHLGMTMDGAGLSQPQPPPPPPPHAQQQQPQIDPADPPQQGDNVQPVAAGELLPKRPGDPDCPYFLKTIKCKFGFRCKFNHPKDKLNSLGAEVDISLLPERPSEPPCLVNNSLKPDDHGISSWGWNLSGQHSTYHALFPRAWTIYDDGTKTESNNSVSDQFLISNGSETELLLSVSDPSLISNGSETKCNYNCTI